MFGSMSAKQRKGDPVGHHLEEHGNVLEERQSAVKNGLEEHHPVWDFKNLKAGRGLV